MPGIEPGAFHMQSERATTALHPLPISKLKFTEKKNKNYRNDNVFTIIIVCSL